jgi:RNA polymerase sigma-70 factor, ECF subfamily
MICMLYAFPFIIFKRNRHRKPIWSDCSNEELMHHYQQGQEEAFAHLIQRLERPLYFYILRLVPHQELARDLVQDTFLRVVKHAHRYETKALVSTWVYTIARNLCIDHLRKKRGKEISLDQPLSGEDDFNFHSILASQSHDGDGLQHSSQKQTMQRIEHALSQINHDQKEVFILRELKGYKFHEIAEILGESENTIKSRMRYALKSLQAHLSEYSQMYQETGGHHDR